MIDTSEGHKGLFDGHVLKLNWSFKMRAKLYEMIRVPKDSNLWAETMQNKKLKFSIRAWPSAFW